VTSPEARPPRQDWSPRSPPQVAPPARAAAPAPAPPGQPAPAASAVSSVLKRTRPVAVSLRERTEALEGVMADLGPACRRCTLSEGRRHVFSGAGRASARLVVLGDQPAPEDDSSGEPFAGLAGLLLTRMLKAIGQPRESVFLTHLVKCRAAEGRDPSRAELDACRPFLLRQIDALGPAVVLTLGPLATAEIMGSTEVFGDLRGRAHSALGTTVIPTFHPAYLLREPRMKRHAWEDLRRVRALLQP